MNEMDQNTPRENSNTLPRESDPTTESPMKEPQQEYWQDYDSVYDVANTRLPEESEVKKEWGSYAPDDATNFMSRDDSSDGDTYSAAHETAFDGQKSGAAEYSETAAPEPNFVLVDENSGLPAMSRHRRYSQPDTSVNADATAANNSGDAMYTRMHSAGGEPPEPDYGNYTGAESEPYHEKHAAKEQGVYHSWNGFQASASGTTNGTSAANAGAYPGFAPGQSTGNGANAHSYVTKRFFVLILIVAMVLTAALSSTIALYFANRGPSYKNLSSSSLQSATGSKLTIGEIANKNADSVVEINTTVGSTGQGAGSGVIVKENGYIVTNYLVTDVATTIAVRLHNGKSYSANVVGYDAQTDIAVLKINASGLNAVTLGRSSKLAVGSLGVVIGNPLGKLGGTVTSGIISSKDRKIELEGRTRTLIQTDASINEGNSGGALFNGSGELVGIVVAKGSGAGVEGLGFAIPIDSIASSIDDIIEHGTVKGKPMAGISIYDAPVENKETGKSSKAVIIAEVKGQNAKDAGLKKGDQVVSINNDNVSTSEELISAIQGHRIGDTVKLGIIRDGNKLSVSLKLQSSVDIK